jgi:hypothetical protein
MGIASRTRVAGAAQCAVVLSVRIVLMALARAAVRGASATRRPAGIHVAETEDAMGRPLIVLSLLTLLLPGCGPRVVRLPYAAPSYKVQENLAAHSRIWVAGFFISGYQDIDVNREAIGILRDGLRKITPATIIDADPLVIDTKERFSDEKYWRRQGEEQGQPLIVTGELTVRIAPPEIVERGVRTFYVPASGRTLDATVVLIDGKTGTAVSSQKLARSTRYGVGRFTSGLYLFFQVMNETIPDWFTAIAGAPRRLPPV